MVDSVLAHPHLSVEEAEHLEPVVDHHHWNMQHAPCPIPRCTRIPGGAGVPRTARRPGLHGEKTPLTREEQLGAVHVDTLVEEAAREEERLEEHDEQSHQQPRQQQDGVILHNWRGLGYGTAEPAGRRQAQGEPGARGTRQKLTVNAPSASRE